MAAITIGSELYTAATKWTSRTDAPVTDRVGEAIALFEAYVNRNLRVRQNETSTTLALSSAGVATLPTDYLSWRAVEYNTSQRINLEYVDRANMTQSYPTSPSDIPNRFTIEGSNLQVMPAATSCVTFRYYQKLTAVSTGTSTSNTNWLLQAHPDAYLFGTIAELYGIMQSPEKMGAWMQRRDLALNEITALHQKGKLPGSVRVQSMYTP